MHGGYVTRSREELKQRQKLEKKQDKKRGSPPKASPGVAVMSKASPGVAAGKEKQKGHGR